ncbi:triose-phosphate isomerase [bacterium]|nr:triose-phosphate isomerase [bacterium]
MRKRIVAGNWKMHKTVPQATELAAAIAAAAPKDGAGEIVVCPPFVNLTAVAGAIKGSSVLLGAQNMHWEEKGAFTGEISAEMLKSAGCRYVILGHSERRQYFGETDVTVNKKIKRALAVGLIPIVCVGETIDQRNAGTTESVVGGQVTGCLADLSAEQAQTLVIAYEPVWAIGTGVTATSEQAQEVHHFIRTLLTKLYSESVAQSVRIQYGGSMKPDNAAQLLAQPDIDGGLIGGASLDAKSFLQIVTA